MQRRHIVVWGGADLAGFSTPADDEGAGFLFAVSFAVPMTPRIMAGIQQGPTDDYAEEYARVNRRINEISESLAIEIKDRGFRALPLAASFRSDPHLVKGDFPHKTAATRAGLGWIGKHCQLITRNFGPWVRLGTVFTDMELTCRPPVGRSFCGRCIRCVEACPAKALKGAAWYAGLPRQEMLDVHACDAWKKEHYHRFHGGHNCGICAAVCPYGLKTLNKGFSTKSIENGNGSA
jgi:epoxyqueuosine reductase QueG